MDTVPSLRTVRPTVPRALGQVVTRALAKVPADRFATAREFGDALETTSSAPALGADDRPTAAFHISRAAPRWRRWLGVAIAGIALAAAARAALTREGAVLERARVLVVPFQNRTGDATLDPLGDAAVDYIAGGLRATHDVEEVVDARSQGEPGEARRLNAAGARAIGRSTGASKIVLGAYDRAPGDSLQFQAQVLDTRTGGVLRLIGPVSAPAGARLAALQGLRTRVMAGVATLLDWDFSEETSRPTTYEALQEFDAGVEAGWCHDRKPGCEARTLEHYYRAAAMDSDFTMPLTRGVAFEYYWRNCARVDSVDARLRPRLGLLPPVDAAELRIATSICHGDLAGALDAATGAAENAPKNALLPSLKAMLLLFANRPQEVISILERVDMTRALDPPRDIAVLLGAYHRLGMYEPALRKIAQLRQIKANTNADMRETYLAEEAASLAALGRDAEVLGKVDEMIRQFQGSTVTNLMTQTGRELAAHGRTAAAQQVFARAITWVKGQQTEQPTSPNNRGELAALLNSAGRWDEALVLDRALAAQDSGDIDARAATGDLAARRGDRVEADRIDRWLAAHQQTGPAGATSEYWVLYQRARIAGLLGEKERAMTLLRDAAEKGFTGWRVAHLDPDLAPLRRDPAFQEWIQPKD
jgi:tetratricopeptide (TPR) repeat protein